MSLTLCGLHLSCFLSLTLYLSLYLYILYVEHFSHDIVCTCDTFPTCHCLSIFLRHVVHLPHANFDLSFVLIWFMFYLSLSQCFHFLFYMGNTSPMTLFVHVIHLPHVIASLGSPSCFCFCVIVLVFVSFYVIRYFPFVLVFSLSFVHVRHLPHHIFSLS